MGELTETGAQVVDGARQEADAYRGDNPRPLGGYLGRVHAPQRIGQGHSDKAGIEHSTGHVGQQRRVEHVVDRRNDGDVNASVRPAQNPGQAPGTAESGETASHDHDGGHRRECRRTPRWAWPRRICAAIIPDENHENR